MYDREIPQLRMVDALMTMKGQEDQTLFYVHISVCLEEGEGKGCVLG